MGLSLDNWPDWAGWMVFEAIFASVFVLEIVVKCVATRLTDYFAACCLFLLHLIAAAVAEL